MFRFIVNYLGFLKFIPGLPLVFDAWLKLWSFATRPELLDWMDEIEAELSRQPGIKIRTHKYGGVQFDIGGKEIGHIHGNGLLDMRLSLKLKSELLAAGRIQDHHVFRNSGWISFNIRTESDKDYALKLLTENYERIKGDNGMSSRIFRRMER